MFGAFARRMGASEQTIGRFLMAALGVGFALLVAAGIAVGFVIASNQRQTERVNHTYEVEIALDEAQLRVEQGEAARRGYLLTRNPAYLTAYRGFAAQTGPAIERVARTTRDNPRQQVNLALYQRMVATLMERRDRTLALMQAGRADEAAAIFAAETTTRRLGLIREQANRMVAEEQRLLIEREAERRDGARTLYAIIAATGVLLLLVGLVTLATVRGYTRDLVQSRNGLRELNETLEEQVAERTADLTRANDEIQRFAYIVSHDLRSPLVNVMGFTAELETAGRELAALVDRVEADAPALLTANARLAAREDLPEAVGFIRTSTQKMDRLINAILRLSREGRRVITPEPLDPADIAETAVAALQHTIDARGIAVEVRRPMPRLVSDRLAVEQILSNLIENATKYLQPGRPGRITVSGVDARGRVVLSVADNGRGIAAGDHQRIFDLFRRSGAQDQPGEGIGLAHVRALAYRLGGTIDVESTLGEGSTFRLVLPAANDGDASLTTLFRPGKQSS